MSYLDKEQKFYDYGTKLFDGRNPFDITKTGMSFYNQLLHDPDYMEEYKESHKEEVSEEEGYSIADSLKMADGTEKEDERKIIKCLREGEKNFDEIFESTQLDTSKLNVLLTSMQITGKIGEKMGRIFFLK